MKGLASLTSSSWTSHCGRVRFVSTEKKETCMRTLLFTLNLAALLGLSTGWGSAREAASEPVPQPATSEPVPEAPRLPQGSQPFELDSADFVAHIDNPFWPMSPGSTWAYRETDGEGNEQQVEVTVTDEKKTILGI